MTMGRSSGDHGIYGHGKSLYWRRDSGSAHRLEARTDSGVCPRAHPGQHHRHSCNHSGPGQPLRCCQPTNLCRGSPWRHLLALGQPVSGWPAPTPELARLHWRTKEAPNYNLPVQSIVTPEWHYIHQENSDILFDWKTDPEETHDLCSAQPTVCSTLRGQIQTADGSPEVDNF